jgi:hypothetical protein
MHARYDTSHCNRFRCARRPGPHGKPSVSDCRAQGRTAHYMHNSSHPWSILQTPRWISEEKETPTTATGHLWHFLTSTKNHANMVESLTGNGPPPLVSEISLRIPLGPMGIHTLLRNCQLLVALSPRLDSYIRHQHRTPKRDSRRRDGYVTLLLHLFRCCFLMYFNLSLVMQASPTL